MKKFTLFLACCIGLMLFASCKKDPIAPTITLMQGEGYLTENAHFYAEEELLIGYVATGEKLTMVETTIKQNGEFISSYPITFDEQPSISYSFNIRIGETGPLTITCTVTDAAEQTASVSINVFCEEKPNAKFLGEYQGNALCSGTMEASVTGMDPIQQEVTDIEMPTILTISEGETMNEVVVTYKINDQESTANGTVEGDKVNIVLDDVPYTFNYPMNGFTISPTLVLNLNLIATLVGDQLQLEGTCKGDGEINLFVYNGTMSIDGTIGGSLTKE